MKGLYLVLLLAGNLFSQTIEEIVSSDSTFIEDLGWIDIGTFSVVGPINPIEVDWTTMEFQDCKGDDWMFNYVSGQIQEIDLSNFGDRQASYYLIQAPEVLEVYQWMRKNRQQYSIHGMVLRVNRLALQAQPKPRDERKLTVIEVDELRNVCENIYLYGSAILDSGSMSRVFQERDMVVAVEEMVRTYILAEITAKDLIEEAKGKQQR